MIEISSVILKMLNFPEYNFFNQYPLLDSENVSYLLPDNQFLSQNISKIRVNVVLTTRVKNQNDGFLSGNQS